jgi:predicted CopG family antitoxin
MRLKKHFKIITVKSRVYKKLLALKRKDESFSDLIERLSMRRNIETLRDLQDCVEFENKDGLLNDIYSKREERRYL